MKLLYLGLFCIFIGAFMVGPGLGMHWQAAIAIIVGIFALGLYIRSFWAEVNASEAADRDPNGPYTVDDFSDQFQNIMLAEIGGTIQVGFDQVDATPEGIDLVVRYGEYWSSIPLTDDLHKMIPSIHLALAIEATSGADPMDAKCISRENISGLREDDYCWWECRFQLTPTNVLAIRATRFSWSVAAEQLALPTAPTQEEIDAVRRRMVELARRYVR